MGNDQEKDPPSEQRTGHVIRRRPATRPPQDARALAWQILQLVEDGGYADALVGSRLPASGLAPRDQGLVTRLVYGTIAWQGFLDHVLAKYCSQPIEKLEIPVRTILRLGLYQAAKLDRIPSFAAVNTAVDLIKSHRNGGAAGMVNAVLRRAVPSWQEVALPSPKKDFVGYLAIQWSHPRWLVERWLDMFGRVETEALLESNNEAAPTLLRVNLLKQPIETLTKELVARDIAAIPARYSPVGLRLEGTSSVLDLGESGTIQNEASQIVGLLAAPQPGQRVLDACAAPGGKTTHLAEQMQDRGQIIALDPHPEGVERVRQAARRLHLHSIRAEVADATTWTDPGNGFDVVLVDAPCSGLGTLREHPEIRWRRILDDVKQVAALQKQILDRVAAMVKPGGALVYSTCTLLREENDDVIAAFLNTHPDFEIESAAAVLPAMAQPLVDADGMVRTLPHRHNMAGFFAARMKRRPTTSMA